MDFRVLRFFSGCPISPLFVRALHYVHSLFYIMYVVVKTLDITAWPVLEYLGVYNVI